MITLDPSEVCDAMRDENPWWAAPHTLPDRHREAKSRLYLDAFARIATQTELQRATVLLGARRVGKSYLIHHLIGRLIAAGTNPGHILYLSIDSPLYHGLDFHALLDHAKQATGFDWRKHPGHVFFDEVQYRKNWELSLKAIIDAAPPAKFTVSGSAAAALRRQSTESGAGRFTDFHLPALTFVEFLELTGRGSLVDEDESGLFSPDISSLNEVFIDYINYGGYPEAALSGIAREQASRFVRSDIIDKVLLRDLPGIYGIRDIPELNALFTSLAFNSCQEITPTELAQRSAIDSGTIKRYIDYLEAAFLLRPLRRLDRDARRFQRDRTFKTVLTNPSLRTALFAPLTATSERLGAMVETAVIAQYFHEQFRQLHYARWPKGEIDLVETSPDLRPIAATEIKFSDRQVKQLKLLEEPVAFCRKHLIENFLVTTRTESATHRFAGVTLTFEPTALHAWRIGRDALARA
jgi:hypothetical protein